MGYEKPSVIWRGGEAAAQTVDGGRYARTVRDLKRDLLRQYARSWHKALSMYQAHRPDSYPTRALALHLTTTSEEFHCRSCGTDTLVPRGVVLQERCPKCRGYEVVWRNEPPLTQYCKPERGVGGLIADPYTGKDFCFSLEGWADLVAYSRHRIAHGGKHFRALYEFNEGLRSQAVNAGVSKSTMHRLTEAWKEEYDA